MQFQCLDRKWDTRAVYAVDSAFGFRALYKRSQYILAVAILQSQHLAYSTSIGAIMITSVGVGASFHL